MCSGCYMLEAAMKKQMVLICIALMSLNTTVQAETQYGRLLPVWEQIVAGSQSNASFQEHVASVKSVVHQGLSAITKPAPDNTYNKETEFQKYWDHETKHKKDTFAAMDEKVKEFVQEYLGKGMSLEEVKVASQDAVGWLQWPTSFSYWERDKIRGVCDTAMTDEEWLAPKNEIVVLYQSRLTATGSCTYIFQNSFRAKKKDLIRAFGSFYGCVTSENGEIQCANLYAEYFFFPGGTSYISSIKQFIGFLSDDSDSAPGLLIAEGPDGQVSKYIIDLYIWNWEYNLWEGVRLWDSEGVLDFEYDGETTDLKYYKCLEQHSDSPDTSACPEIVNLREYYLETKTNNEKSLQPGIPSNSFLKPPKDVYETKGKPIEKLVIENQPQDIP